MMMPPQLLPRPPKHRRGYSVQVDRARVCLVFTRLLAPEYDASWGWRSTTELSHVEPVHHVSVQRTGGTTHGTADQSAACPVLSLPLRLLSAAPSTEPQVSQSPPSGSPPPSSVHLHLSAILRLILVAVLVASSSRSGGTASRWAPTRILLIGLSVPMVRASASPAPAPPPPDVSPQPVWIEPCLADPYLGYDCLIMGTPRLARVVDPKRP